MRQDHIGLVPRSLLLRNIAFICEMAGATPWNVVNLVSSTQAIGKNDERKSFADPTEEVRGYLHPDWQNCFTYRTWEMLYESLSRKTLTSLRWTSIVEGRARTIVQHSD